MDVETWQPVDGDWRSLHEPIDPLLDRDPPRGAEAVLRTFERFPTEDGWGVLRVLGERLEEIEGYEELVLASLARRPSVGALAVIEAGRKYHANARFLRPDVDAALAALGNAEESIASAAGAAR